MATQTTSGRKLFDQIRAEHRKLVKIKNRSAQLVKLAEQQKRSIKALMKKLSRDDFELYREQFEKMSKQLN